ncbi:aminoglycoside phosphotransferase family protein [Deinococcus yavapaiensis]|uniref:Fructosamine-3-kinase n=1 Tax=Deinococcus yavapaiensis KR-236 TaxID=694435 RepID=A0A318S8G8_9DEIO|nr:aminoglycoside phosphotransferase family protein [Deinococcus yavapaiensis]PYE51922.1 fructosamine-3-kinase [Deinococcus yavapaiensis KR-236]
MSSRVTADVRALVLHPTEALVLTVEGVLPSATTSKNVQDGAGVPDLFAFLVPEKLRFLRRLAFTFERTAPDAWHLEGTFALEAAGECLALGAWTPIDALGETDAAFARLAFAPDERIPWWRRGWLREALAWLDGALEALGERREGDPTFVRSWQISALYRVRTTDGTRYLKAVPSFFARESRVTRWLHELHTSAAPAVLAARGDTLFLMASAGDRSFGEEDALSLARHLAAVQRLTETRHADLLALGCARRSLADLAADVHALLASDPLLSVGDLSAADVAALRALEPRLIEACERLAASPIASTVVHGDLHAGNVMFDGSIPTLLDWSDAALGFPFLDANPAYFLAKEAPREAEDAMRDAYLQAWTNVLPLPDLRALHADATLLGELHRAVSYVKFIAPHVPDPAEWADAHVWHLKRALELARLSDAPLPTRGAAAGTD